MLLFPSLLFDPTYCAGQRQGWPREQGGGRTRRRAKGTQNKAGPCDSERCISVVVEVGDGSPQSLNRRFDVVINYYDERRMKSRRRRVVALLKGDGSCKVFTKADKKPTRCYTSQRRERWRQKHFRLPSERSDAFVQSMTEILWQSPQRARRDAKSDEGSERMMTNMCKYVC